MYAIKQFLQLLANGTLCSKMYTAAKVAEESAKAAQRKNDNREAAVRSAIKREAFLSILEMELS